MKRITVNSTLFFLILCSACQLAYCGWSLVGQFPGEHAECGYFWDEQNGLVGFGMMILNPSSIRNIRWTSDGGKTWNLSITPGGKGAVTSIFMKDQLVGYASVFSKQVGTIVSAIWKTGDGGKTWVDHSFGDDENTECVYATSASLIRTNWYGAVGGSSIDDGKNYRSWFTSTSFAGDNSNGIDFTDDAMGVVTMGPNNDGSFSNPWYTNDGGINWKTGTALPEAWGVYGVKGTKTFITLPEGRSGKYNQNVYRSDNGGNTWNSIFSFSFFDRFTGHIGGGGTAAYVQSDITNSASSGLFRSDNLGQNWKNVGGPSNFRDSRFVVTGCVGQVVYAFNDQGEIWKTTDGGDGTLSASTGGSLLSFSNDSLYEETRYCQPITWTITLINPACSALIIDAVSITPNPYNEFSIGGTINGSTVPISSSLSVPITFRTDSNVTRHAVLHIKAHSGASSIDTTIILVAKHSTAPEPYLLDMKATKVGDTVEVPVYIHVTKDSFAMSHIAFHLSYDGDILTPAFENYRTYGTLSTKAKVTIGVPEPNGIFVTLDLPKPITQDSDLTKPLINLRMGVTLSRYLSCLVRLDTFAISNTAPIPLCNIPLAEFKVDAECGDSTISAFMLQGKMPSFLFVHPNPNPGNEVEAVISLPEQSNLGVDVVDMNGNIILKNISEGLYEKGVHPLKLNTAGLTNGTYILQLHSGNRSYSSTHMVIRR